MALSPNPFTEALGNASKMLSSVTNQSGGSFSGISFAESKAALEGTVNRLSGGIGSAFNGATAGNSGIGTAFSGLGNPIQSAIGGISNVAADIGASINKFGLGGALGGLGGLAGTISAGAGQLNNVLSMFRGRNLPSGAELFEQRGSMVSVSTSNAEDWRIRINANFSLFDNAFDRLVQTNGVVWPYTPSVSITSKANYTSIDTVHNNYAFHAYKNSQIEDITISGDFSCETETDASYWIAATTFFKTATKMFFGASPNAGNPPIICNLSGYGPGVLNNIPVIIKSFQMELPEDVNYIQCSTSNFGPTWVPILSKVTVTVAPIYNRTRLRQFNLTDYANGNALGYI